MEKGMEIQQQGSAGHQSSYIQYSVILSNIDILNKHPSGHQPWVLLRSISRPMAGWGVFERMGFHLS